LEDTLTQHRHGFNKDSSPEPSNNRQKNVILTILKFPE
jgi:hypothetical protein